jgi:septal ring factor EnvC (AmiA/AmiB activator)
VYRAPVAGRLVIGLDELSASGVRSRGLTFAVAPRAGVAAPAGGTIRYAGRFRGYGDVVIIDHGAGWTTLVTGLGETLVATGQAVTMGRPIGRANAGEDARVTIELRRRGRPIDMTMLMG